MLSLALFVIWFSALAFLITRLLKNQAALSPANAVAAFAFKVLAGCLYGYVHLRYYQGDDTWAYNVESLEEYAKLVRQPLVFFADLWPATIHSSQSVSDYVLNNLERNLTVKLLALFNLFSRGNYYVNVIFFNFLLFWGHYWLFIFIDRRFPGRRLTLLLFIFFIPTTAFWLSGMRGDGIVFLFITLLFREFSKWLSGKSAVHLLTSMLCLAGIFIFRSAVMMVLVPFLLGWGISSRPERKPLPVYLVIYFLLAVVFFTGRYIHPALNFPAIVIQKQEAFMALPGKTRFAMEPLSPHLWSFLKAIPSALVNVLVRPFPWEVHGVLQVITSAETIFFLLFIFLSLPFITYRKLFSDPWTCGIVFFCLSLFLFIGLTIPFPGAIIRYKAIPELLLMVGMAVSYRRIIKN
jgi:hypothetical protein